jgi:hypothetical protein
MSGRPLADQMLGKALSFVTVNKQSGKIVGSTRFGNIDSVNRRAEIGWTWINPEWQADGHQYRGKVTDADARVRGMEMHPRRAKNRRQ